MMSLKDYPQPEHNPLWRRCALRGVSESGCCLDAAAARQLCVEERAVLSQTAAHTGAKSHSWITASHVRSRPATVTNKLTRIETLACSFLYTLSQKNIPWWVGFFHRLLKHRGCCVICSPRLFRPNSGGRARTHSTECALECGNLATGPERQIRLAMGDCGSSA